jgi:hypothetical protein
MLGSDPNCLSLGYFFIEKSWRNGRQHRKVTVLKNIDKHADSVLTMGTPELWHKRAREAAVEQRQLLITLATACLAIFFVTMTSDKALDLTTAQRVFARIGLLAMGTSIFSGVAAVFGDARRCYNLARQLQAETASEIELAEKFGSRYRAYFKTLTVCSWIQRATFLLGIATTVTYTLSLLK